MRSEHILICAYTYFSATWGWYSRTVARGAPMKGTFTKKYCWSDFLKKVFSDNFVFRGHVPRSRPTLYFLSSNATKRRLSLGSKPYDPMSMLNVTPEMHTLYFYVHAHLIAIFAVLKQEKNTNVAAGMTILLLILQLLLYFFAVNRVILSRGRRGVRLRY